MGERDPYAGTGIEDVPVRPAEPLGGPPGHMSEDTEDSADGNGLTREVSVTCTWKSEHRVTVPASWNDTGHLDGFPPEALEEMTAHTASLTDWEVRG
jgi:hypothetical protein